MAKYIPLDALVAEIDKLENKLYYEPEDFKDVGAKMALDSLKSSLNTLEVKEVDLDEETLHSELRKIYASIYDSKDIKSAKHFFELGLQASIKTQKG